MIGRIFGALVARLRQPLRMLLEPSSWAGIAGVFAGLAQWNVLCVYLAGFAGVMAVLLKGSAVKVPPAAAVALGFMLALALAPAPVRAAEPTPSPTLEQMIAICRLPGPQALEALHRLPDQVQAATTLVCVGYTRGQLDLLRAIQGTPATGKRI